MFVLLCCLNAPGLWKSSEIGPKCPLDAKIGVNFFDNSFAFSPLFYLRSDIDNCDISRNDT